MTNNLFVSPPIQYNIINKFIEAVIIGIGRQDNLNSLMIKENIKLTGYTLFYKQGGCYKHLLMVDSKQTVILKIKISFNFKGDVGRCNIKLINNCKIISQYIKNVPIEMIQIALEEMLKTCINTNNYLKFDGKDKLIRRSIEQLHYRSSRPIIKSPNITPDVILLDNTPQFIESDFLIDLIYLHKDDNKWKPIFNFKRNKRIEFLYDQKNDFSIEKTSKYFLIDSIKSRYYCRIMTDTYLRGKTVNINMSYDRDNIYSYEILLYYPHQQKHFLYYKIGNEYSETPLSHSDVEKEINDFIIKLNIGEVYDIHYKKII